MGEGSIVENGTHNELLQNENGAYARLVRAQRLRERQGKQGHDGDTTPGGESEDTEKAVLKEEPLGRKDTGRSLGSEILEQKLQAGNDPDKEKDHSLAYLFMRMGKINSDQWWKYALGAMFAISMWCQAFCSLYLLIQFAFGSDWNGLSRVWNCLWRVFCALFYYVLLLTIQS